MANTTFKGPVRSQNGFLEWNGTAWVPVQGGGGGGDVIIYLNNGSFLSYGSQFADNRYSDNSSQNPPTGDTAGTIIQLPAIDIGQSYLIISISGGNSPDAWALQLPSIPGVDISYLNPQFQMRFSNPNAPASATQIPPNSYVSYGDTYYVQSIPQGPSIPDTMYIYGEIVFPLRITRVADLVVPGFGTVSQFNQTGTPTVMTLMPFPNPLVYPYSNLIVSP